MTQLSLAAAACRVFPIHGYELDIWDLLQHPEHFESLTRMLIDIDRINAYWVACMVEQLGGYVL